MGRGTGRGMGWGGVKAGDVAEPGRAWVTDVGFATEAACSSNGAGSAGVGVKGRGEGRGVSKD